MSDYLLRGLEEIHKDLFYGKNGRPVISFSTFRQKIVISEGKKIRLIDDMKRLGILFQWRLGRAKRPVLCGWRSQVRNYFTLLAQEEYEEQKAADFLGY